MRSAVAFLVVAWLAAGCGSARHEQAAATTAVAAKPAGSKGSPVGVVGTLDVHVPGAAVAHIRLGRASHERLVLVSAGAVRRSSLVAAAVAHPSIQFALIGRTAVAEHLPNLAGIVLRDDQAAHLGGVVAGLAAAEESGPLARVAWVGPRQPALAAAFRLGVHSVAPGTIVLRAWASGTPASCKESALGAIGRGATVVMAPHGLCAAAAIDGAHQQNHPGLELSDFELPGVPATQIVREAVAGVFHGGEDVVFGGASGAIGVRTLDPLFSEAVAVRARAAAGQLARGAG
jgi:basic membrane lipoprotein Med (substrate-binding protein (PBP1-ABC) superfamily)